MGKWINPLKFLFHIPHGLNHGVYFQQIEDNFNKAAVSNDIEKIKKCITNDWVLVDS